MKKISKSKMFLLKCQFNIWKAILSFLFSEMMHMFKDGNNKAIIILFFYILLTILIELLKILMGNYSNV